jgi:dihydroneopterin triphosphate aldolase (PTPS-III) / 6-pyruvoyltetrahydropterin synthase
VPFQLFPAKRASAICGAVATFADQVSRLGGKGLERWARLAGFLADVGIISWSGTSGAKGDKDRRTAVADFSIHVAKENLKFSAAHFIAYPGFREPLHGHNYQVGIKVEGRLAANGYVLDFGLIKKLTRQIVERLDEHTIIPAQSDCLEIRQQDGQVNVVYEGDRFVFPAADVALLPIMHSSAEELARFIWTELYGELTRREALGNVSAMEVSVAEGPGQAAIYRQELFRC